MVKFSMWNWLDSKVVKSFYISSNRKIKREIKVELQSVSIITFWAPKNLLQLFSIAPSPRPPTHRPSQSNWDIAPKKYTIWPSHSNGIYASCCKFTTKFDCGFHSHINRLFALDQKELQHLYGNLLISERSLNILCVEVSSQAHTAGDCIKKFLYIFCTKSLIAFSSSFHTKPFEHAMHLFLNLNS